MTWTAPATYSTGQVLTAANLNTYLRDNMDYLGGTARPHARVYNSANISLTTATTTVLTYDSERIDVGAIHSTVSNTGRLTVPTGAGGWWNVGGGVAYTTSGAGVERTTTIRLNGATLLAATRATPSASAASLSSLSTAYQMAVGDYFEMTALQDSGGNLNLLTQANYSPEFWAQWECV